MEKYIFISYAHKDSQSVIPIIDGLRQAGVNVWYDEGIEAGTEWPETIEKKLVGCSAILVFVSPASISSQNCRNEINLALSLRKEMLTVYLAETTLTGGMSLQLGTIQALFKYRHPSHKSFMQALLGSEFIAGFLDGGDTAPIRRPAAEPKAVKPTGANPLDIIARAPRFATVKFGSYPQSTMHPEPIKWILVKKSCGEALLVAKDVLDCRDFSTPYDWSHSKMRSWLNGEFARTAFSASELSCISENERFTDTGDGVQKTSEKVFLLDVAEVRENFHGWLRSRYMNAKPTAYAKRKGAYMDNKFCIWWLRCSNKVSVQDIITTDWQFYSNYLRGSKKTFDYLYYHHSVQNKNAMTSCREANPPQILEGIGVRPAIWVRYL